jgi:hypothetical protein
MVTTRFLLLILMVTTRFLLLILMVTTRFLRLILQYSFHGGCRMMEEQKGWWGQTYF